MCGIFGLLALNKNSFSNNIIKRHIDDLLTYSENRGKDAAGIAIKSNNNIYMYKNTKKATLLKKDKKYKDILNKTLNEEKSIDNSNNNLMCIGHCRMSTNGISNINNAQPIIQDSIIGVHNGIIVKVNDSKKNNINILNNENDTEILFSLFNDIYNGDIVKTLKKTFDSIEGSTSLAMMSCNNNLLVLATNTGSIYYCINLKIGICIFASEKHIINKIINKKKYNDIWNNVNISHLLPNNTLIIDPENLNYKIIGLKSNNISYYNNTINISNIIDYTPYDDEIKIKKTDNIIDEELYRLFKNKPNHKLKRCKKCILPNSFPLIDFDNNGVCNYCNNYKKITIKGKKELEKIVAPYRSNNNDPDCIVGFSGGRDSSYMLHYLKKELGMNPIAYTYDWGMVTELARRNQARICGKLGIEHIIVSADIAKKRKNVKNNIKAWLKKPELGMVPLLMGGDKQFYYHAYKIMKNNNIELLFNGGCYLEKTDFKLGFCGIKNNVNGSTAILTGLSPRNKIRLLLYYMKQYFTNPYYINSSLIDTLHAYYSTYLLPDKHIYFYNYIKWNEEIIIKTLINEYNWEMASDSPSTWRIGDGTAAFYDYIYFTVTGFSEYDTFKSNQIREGMITRDSALYDIENENEPRIESLKWYADIIGFDLKNAIKIINDIPKKY